MSEYRLQSICVEKLWGWRNFDISFKPDVNFLIGNNGSGKTSLLYLIRHILAGDVRQLSNMHFHKATLKLIGFSSPSTRTLSVEHADDKIIFTISNKLYSFSIEHLQIDRRRYAFRPIERKINALHHDISGLVPTVWLPVTRRLDITQEQDDDIRNRKQEPAESVDERLSHLLSRLRQYRLKLESNLAGYYRVFERDALSIFLYDKDVDNLKFPEVHALELTQEDRESLTNSFQGTGLFDSRIQSRIKMHFDRAAKAVNHFRESEKRVDIEHLLLLPLIWRTKSIIEKSRLLENEKISLFAPLRKYELIVNRFLIPKVIDINDDGVLHVIPEIESGVPLLTARHLSSGEKQILILLTQALLNEGNPVVYMADEPELSLHVEWQAMLIESIISLANDVQVIVATHSPDIVSNFSEHLISLDPHQ